MPRITLRSIRATLPHSKRPSTSWSKRLLWKVSPWMGVLVSPKLIAATATRRVGGAAIMDDRNGIPKSGQEARSGVAGGDDRHMSTSSGGAAFMDERTKTSALRSDDARRATLILEDHVGGLTGIFRLSARGGLAQRSGIRRPQVVH